MCTTRKLRFPILVLFLSLGAVACSGPGPARSSSLSRLGDNDPTNEQQGDDAGAPQGDCIPGTDEAVWQCPNGMTCVLTGPNTDEDVGQCYSM